jgi:succinyl-CoA synthetase beta subunit
MKIHEYQAKSLFDRYNIPIPKGSMVTDASEAGSAARALIEQTGNDTLVVKAQIHAGGRGKAGGVKVVRGVEAAGEAAKKMFGSRLVTKQTGPLGAEVGRVLIEQGLDIAQELYVGMVVDRDERNICLITSRAGGVDIEETAASHPEKINKRLFSPTPGLLPFVSRQVAFDLNLSGAVAGRAARLLQSLAELFIREDASMVEINPLVITKDGSVIALDAKMTFDDNAAFRHKDHVDLFDPSEENEMEALAQSLGFSYVAMDGDIGCCVNGAGLAMATMDIIKHMGGTPANFLDVGGGADAHTVKKAFEIILSDSRVKAIFVNIFGGILKCDVLAEGVISAVREMGIRVPLVVRLEGTNVEKGRALLAESGLAIVPARDMKDGAERVIALAAG